jgi:hypothetical protein
MSDDNPLRWRLERLTLEEAAWLASLIVVLALATIALVLLVFLVVL